VKERLAPYKYPRWIEFTSELPTTATGNITRHPLRGASHFDSCTPGNARECRSATPGRLSK